ncbi:CCA tRNA nucleotidyltransferase, mitochondrial [Blastocladiella emersonii ATCC 22665]|nr:CCA tRNA nucleotidyltransferase, mitochondrial [Blastocladiella emersonii ATCC 22665]
MHLARTAAAAIKNRAPPLLLSRHLATTTATMDPADLAITPTVDEQRLFRLLNAAARHAPQPVVCRVAGGWVRDKLLGKESDDLDIALDTMMGYDFAQVLAAYVRDHADEAHAVVSDAADAVDAARAASKHGPHAALFAGLAKIQSNPDKSKHLETATCRVLGYDLDFVNLRSETYQEHSRIPAAVEFGTPLQDAQRRDCTINALFYSVATAQVEDWTGRGLLDLAHQVIRTPLAARETFHDDPLRVLRAVRFASRLGFRLDESVVAAVRDDPAIHDALANKISKERIGVEVGKMLAGPSPAHAIAMLDHLGVLRTVAFAHFDELRLFRRTAPHNLALGAPTLVPATDVVPAELAEVQRDVNLTGSQATAAALEWLARTRPDRHATALLDALHLSSDASLLPALDAATTTAFLSAVTLPFAPYACSVPRTSSIFPHTAKKPQASQVHPPAAIHPLAPHVVKTNLKLTNHDAEWVALCHAAVPHVSAMALAYRADPAARPAAVHKFAWTGAHEERVALGQLVRRVGGRGVGGAWRAAVTVALAADLAPHLAIATDPSSLIPRVTGLAAGHESAARDVARGYAALLSRIATLRLGDAWSAKPAINGNDVAKSLQVPKGPLLKEALEWVMEFQLAHDTTAQADALAWMREHFHAGAKREHENGGESDVPKKRRASQEERDGVALSKQ